MGLFSVDMVFTSKYRLKYDSANDTYTVISYESHVCPVCGVALTGYDTRRRFSIDTLGNRRCFAVRRLFCKNCKKYHIELPSFMTPYKHYDSSVIELASQSTAWGYCPADDSTIRRWKKT